LQPSKRFRSHFFLFLLSAILATIVISFFLASKTNLIYHLLLIPIALQ
jgi:hypothetical protein